MSTFALNPKDWFYWGQWIQPPLSTDFWLHWGETESVKKLTLNKLTSNVITIESHFYLWEKDYNTFLKESFAAAEKERFFYYRNFKNVTSNTIKNLLRTQKALEKKSTLELKDLECFFHSFQELIGPWSAVFPISTGIERFLEKQLEKHKLNIAELSPLFQPAHKPWVNIQYQEMNSFIESLAKKRLLKILENSSVTIIKQLTRRAPNLLKLMKNHVSRFAWMGTHHFWGNPFTLNKLIKEMKREAKKYPFKPNSIKKKLKLPAKVNNLIKIVNRLTYWRFRCAEVSDYATFFLRPHLTRVARNLGLSYNELVWFTTHEIIKALATDRKLDKQVVALRRKKFGIVYFQKKEEMIAGDKLKQVKNILKEEIKEDVKIIKGVVGSKGFAKGRVHIVAEPKDMRNFKKGGVLVSPETTPDFVPAMKLASAIVTDIGGLTSHAAIVSRELKIPCIIGTKIATKVLKDGDIVEVDAEKGVVRILKGRLAKSINKSTKN